MIRSGYDNNGSPEDNGGTLRRLWGSHKQAGG
jgi:hypothetical protein